MSDEYCMNTQCILGLQCDGFVMLAADQMHMQSIITLNNDTNRLFEINDTLLMGVLGKPSEAVLFTQFISKNMQLYKIRNGYNLDTDAVVHFTRKILSDGLRKPNPVNVNLLIAGYDDKKGSQLYYLDFLATCIKAPIVSHGYGGFLCMGILDQYHKPTLSEVQAYDILKLCVHEIHRRFIYSLQDFQVKVVCKSGTHELPTITKI